jgi:hypothetical protein
VIQWIVFRKQIRERLKPRIRSRVHAACLLDLLAQPFYGWVTRGTESGKGASAFFSSSLQQLKLTPKPVKTGFVIRSPRNPAVKRLG